MKNVYSSVLNSGLPLIHRWVNVRLCGTGTAQSCFNFNIVVPSLECINNISLWLWYELLFVSAGVSCRLRDEKQLLIREMQFLSLTAASKRVLISVIELSSYMIWMWSHDFSHWVIIIYDMNVESWFQSLSYHHIWYECGVMISVIELSSYMIWMWSHDFSHWVIIIYDMNVESWFQSLSYHHIWYECGVMISVIELSSYMIWMWSHDFSHWVIIIYDMNVESWFQSLSYHHIWYECRVMISVIELSSYMIWM